MVVVPKSNDKLRICVDYMQLNEAVKRERAMLPTVENVSLKCLVKFFSDLDVNCGFHPIKVFEDSKPLSTSRGRYIKC